MTNYKYWGYNLFMCIILVLLIMPLSCCSSSEVEKNNKKKLSNSHESHKDDEKDAKTSIKLTEKEIKEFQIVVKTVGSGVIQQHINLNGEIIPIPTKIAHIKPRFSGIVKDVRKTIGDKVRKGEVVAIIESNENLVNYKLKSAINGIVIDQHFTIGESVGDDSHQITIANLNTVWGNFSIYQKDLSDIKINQMAEITTMDEKNKNIGKISYISPIIDEVTRTASARISLNNKDGFWKPGMFVTAKVFTTKKKVRMVVTTSAIQSFDGQKVVFIEEHQGFRPQPVTIGLENSKNVEILSGLYPGQSYISKGAFMIKAEIQKDSFGEGDEH